MIVIKTSGRMLTFAGVLLLAVSPGHAFAVSRPASASTTGEERDDTKIVQQIVDGMRASQKKLGERDTGKETRRIQDKVISDLQKLIEAANKGTPTGDVQAGEQKRRQGQQQIRSDSSDQQGQAKNQPSGNQSQSGQSTGTQPGKRSGGGKPVQPPAGQVIPRSMAVQRQVWGHLPAAVRNRVPADFGESVLPAYDDLVRHYFDALLEGSQSAAPKGPSSAAPASTPSPPK